MRALCNSFVHSATAAAVTAALLTVIAMACGSSGGPTAHPAKPASSAPRNVIVFGAQGQDGTFGVYLVGPDGAGLRKLSDEAAAVSSPRWSPDGDRVAYIAGTNPGSLRVYDFATSQSTTLSENVLTNDLGAPLSWSPASQRIAFIENVSGGRLRVYDLAAGRLSDIEDVPAIAVEWSPSGSTLAIVRSASAQQSEIDTVKSDGSAAEQFLAGDGLRGEPVWSADGKRLAAWSALSAQLTSRTLATYKPNGDKQSDLGSGLDPAWSTDGQLAYSRPQSVNSGATIDIYLLPKAGGQPQPVVRATALARWPAWSPLDDALTYTALVDQSTALLCTAELATQKQSCLDLGGLIAGQSAWSPF